MAVCKNKAVSEKEERRKTQRRKTGRGKRGRRKRRRAEEKEAAAEERNAKALAEAAAAGKKIKAPKKKGGLLKTLYEAEGIDGLVTILRTTLYHTGTFLNSLMRGFVIDELYVDVRCSKQDAAETAVYYGEVCSVLFPLFGALASKCRLKKYDINVYPDYLAKFSDASFVTKLHFTPIYLLGITLAYVFRLLFGVILKVVFKISGANKNKKSSRDKNNKSKEKRDAK